MSIKLITLSLMIVCMMAASLTTKAISSSMNSNTISVTINDDSARIIAMEKRVSEIQAMDLQNLSPVEKKNLRAELQQMRREAGTYRGVYISVGALIIIILLLILILR